MCACPRGPGCSTAARLHLGTGRPSTAPPAAGEEGARSLPAPTGTPLRSQLPQQALPAPPGPALPLPHMVRSPPRPRCLCAPGPRRPPPATGREAQGAGAPPASPLGPRRTPRPAPPPPPPVRGSRIRVRRRGGARGPAPGAGPTHGQKACRPTPPPPALLRSLYRAGGPEHRALGEDRVRNAEHSAPRGFSELRRWRGGRARLRSPRRDTGDVLRHPPHPPRVHVARLLPSHGHRPMMAPGQEQREPNHQEDSAKQTGTGATIHSYSQVAPLRSQHVTTAITYCLDNLLKA